MSEQQSKNDICKIVRREFKAVGTRHEAKYSEYSSVIPRSFEALIRRLHEITNRTGVKLALYEVLDTPAPDKIGIYFAAVQVTELGDVPDGMVNKINRESTYALYTHRGDMSKIGEAYDVIERWIGENGYRHAKGLIVESMDERFNPGSPESELEIYVPIEEK